MASLGAQSVKNLPAMQETQVQFLGQKDPLEKRMATHSNTLAWRIQWSEEPGGLLNNNPCQIDDLKSWRETELTQSKMETGGRKERNLGFHILSCLPYSSPCSDKPFWPL